MPTMNISLTTELAKFVEREVKSGSYGSASELVRESLRMLEREKEVQEEKHALLKAAVQAGIDQADANEFSPRSIDEIIRAAMNDR